MEFIKLRKSTIAAKLIFYMVLSSSFLTLLITTIQLYLDYRNDMSLLEARMNEIEISYVPPLTTNLWKLDQRQIQLQLKSILQLPDIVYLEIQSPENKVIYSQGTPSENNKITRKFSLTYQYKKKERALGLFSVTASLDKIYERLKNKVFILLGSNAIKTFIVTSFMFVLFQLLVTRHLTKLAEHAKQLTTGTLGNSLSWDRSSPSKYKDELDEVSFAINTMQSNLEKSYQVIQKHQENLEDQVKQRTSALESSNKELFDFASIVSHDLKEPLRGIEIQSQFLLEDYENLLDEEGKKKLERLKILTHHMRGLLETLLYYSRVGQTELALKPTNLDQVLDDILDRIKDVIQEQHVVIRRPHPLPTILCDAVRIGELFHNLISNAIKYNDKPQKWIAIKYHEKEGVKYPVFSIEDNGIGLKEKNLESIFQIFKRLHHKDEYGGGTGAGLAFVKKIVDRHDGRIWVESILGEGSTFYFTLQEDKE